jgi:hypothetical protein
MVASKADMAAPNRDKQNVQFQWRMAMSTVAMATANHNMKLVRVYQEARNLAIEEKVNRALRASSYGPVRAVTCEARQKKLILNGVVPNFFMKQVSQAIVRELGIGDRVIENRIKASGMP